MILGFENRSLSKHPYPSPGKPFLIVLIGEIELSVHGSYSETLVS
jgi:hypothetical protein